MTMPRAIRTCAVPERPWRNGGGVARDLLSVESEAGQLLVSVADIDADGPFSAYPGTERWFAVAEGAGVALTIDGIEHRLGIHDTPLRFAGGATTTCRLLDGRTRDLNLMLRGIAGGLHRAWPGRPWRPRHAACGLYAATPGQCRWAGQVVDVAAHTLLWFDPAPADPLECDSGAAWWIEAGAVLAAPSPSPAP